MRSVEADDKFSPRHFLLFQVSTTGAIRTANEVKFEQILSKNLCNLMINLIQTQIIPFF